MLSAVSFTAREASHTISTRRSKSPSFVTTAAAPARSTSAISWAVTDAVRQTTRVVGSASSTSRVASAPFRPGMR